MVLFQTLFFIYLIQCSVGFVNDDSWCCYNNTYIKNIVCLKNDCTDGNCRICETGEIEKYCGPEQVCKENVRFNISSEIGNQALNETLMVDEKHYCHQKTCVPKCCDKHEIIENGKCVSLKNDVNVNFKPIINNNSSDYKITYNKMSTRKKTYLCISIPGDEFSIVSNSSVVYNFNESNTYGEYCVDFFMENFDLCLYLPLNDEELQEHLDRSIVKSRKSSQIIGMN